jgi:energy-coupling factor transporter ATP-binding protein EcfA2
MHNSIAFLEAFNAKQMTTADIAASFVPSQKFGELAGAWNALLIGPRGSGKTTLLKMLQLKALRSWRHHQAESYRQGINYTGIFVPADIAWGGMVDQLGRGKLEEEAQILLSETVFCTNVFQSVVEAMIDRITVAGHDLQAYRVASADKSALRTAIETIAGSWKLSPMFYSLESLKLSINQRLMQIKEKATILALTGRPTASDVLAELPFAAIDVISAVEGALVEFDAAIGDPEGRWALLLDEFEIAPLHLQTIMLSQFRSSNKKLFFKVALAPCTPHTSEAFGPFGSANKRDDYRQVELWYPDRTSAASFCDAVFRARMSAYKNFANRSPEEVLGRSAYVITDGDEAEDLGQSYGRGKDWSNAFVGLRDKDPDFADFLVRRGIDPYNLDPSPDAPNGNTIRKIAPLVGIREAHLRTQGRHVRGRKKLVFAYSGWRAVSAISEGNPRWLIGILNMIASRFENISSLPISSSVQSDLISGATEAFKSMLKTVATNQPIGIKTKTPVFELIEEIGKYFFDRVVKDKFIEEPPLAFRVDDEIDPDIENALRIALNHGAIVYMPVSGESRDFGSLRGKKFRIAYLLAPSFHLPLRATKEIVLSSILSRDKQTEMRAFVPLPKKGQGSLFE